MIGATGFLLRRTLANRARRLRAQLRSPRYALALLVGAGYLGLIFLGPHNGGSQGLTARTVGIGGSAVTAFLLAKWWLFGADRLALAFSSAEIQFLFPAPVSRRMLLGYKLLRNQLLLWFNVLLWTLLTSRAAGAGALPVGLRMLSLWACFTILSLHRLGVALSRDTLSERADLSSRGRWAVAGVVAATAAVLGATWLRLPGSAIGLERATALFSTAPLSWLLLPLRLPFLSLGAGSLADWWLPFLGAVAVIGLHLLWILRADRAFEEAAIRASVRRMELLERWRKQGATGTPRPARRLRWPRLRASGHPVGAIVWKNVTRLLRTLSPRFLLIMAAAVVGGLIYGTGVRSDEPEVLTVVGTLAASWTMVLALLGPQWVRNDLRGDLEQLPMLRTWPLSGAQLVGAQIASAAIVLTVLETGLGIVALVAIQLSGASSIPVAAMVALLVPALLALSGVNFLALGLQNAGAVLYPAWVRTEIRPGGIESVGQHLLTAGVSLVLLGILVLGPGLLAAGLGYLLWSAWSWWALAPSAALAAVGLFLEAFLLLDWLGSRFERLDLTADR